MGIPLLWVVGEWDEELSISRVPYHVSLPSCSSVSSMLLSLQQREIASYAGVKSAFLSRPHFVATELFSANADAIDRWLVW